MANVSQETLSFGSTLRKASRTEFEILSPTLSGWLSETYSEVKTSSRRRVELAICATIALVFGARGFFAIWSRSYWLAARYAPPRHYEGTEAVLLGVGEIELALLIAAAWLWFSRGRKGAGAATAAIGALAFLGGFTTALFG